MRLHSFSIFLPLLNLLSLSSVALPPPPLSSLESPGLTFMLVSLLQIYSTFSRLPDILNSMSSKHLKHSVTHTILLIPTHHLCPHPFFPQQMVYLVTQAKTELPANLWTSLSCTTTSLVNPTVIFDLDHSKCLYFHSSSPWSYSTETILLKIHKDQIVQ